MLAARALSYWFHRYRVIWRSSLVVSLVNPVLFLAAMGLGLGSVIDDTSGSAGALGDVDYLAFLAPGLLATTAMQVAAIEASFPVMLGRKWMRQYDAQLATPLSVDDVALGHLSFMAIRIAIASAAFVAVMVLFGAPESFLVVAALPAAVLTGAAFATPIAAFAVTRHRDDSFNLVFRFGVMPMFLFSGTFYPVSRLPDRLEPVAWVTPLWHGVELCRAFSLGTADTVPVLGHTAYLAAWVVGGGMVALHNYRRMLTR